ncbi:MAG TPA: 50S ribosomal protein L11 methyltransferase [Gemmatimonadales bacterium]|jgi:ribosomal protein L11 methyltransferase|nr:50S ribosomal protein L11 methyltransferase [Gemmatimonadales bacterium]
MSWCAVDVRSPADERDAVAMWLVGHTGQAVEEREDGVLVGVAESEAAASSLLLELQSAFGEQVAGSARKLPEVDWRERWHEGLGPRRIGRLVVTPSWVAVGNGALTVVVDPETAFGTGEHGSTRTALLLLDRHLRFGDRVLDLGSGSGILAIAAAKLGAARATGIDSDPEAEPIAAANAERNGVAGSVRFLTADAATLVPLLAPAELILSNILRSQNEALLPVVHAALAPDGRAIFAGMEQAERGEFLSALLPAGFQVFDEAVDAPWWAVAARPA